MEVLKLKDTSLLILLEREVKWEVTTGHNSNCASFYSIIGCWSQEQRSSPTLVLIEGSRGREMYTLWLKLCFLTCSEASQVSFPLQQVHTHARVHTHTRVHPIVRTHTSQPLPLIS